jgi:hypothetical protein
MTKIRRHNILIFIGVITAFLLFTSGCSTTQFSKNGSSSVPTVKKRGPAPLYYDFEDVLLPKQMKLDKKSSFVFKTPGVSAGVLVLSGWIDANSLITFFENNMAKDNWNMLTSFKSRRTIMLYQKETRWCVINITDRDFGGTHVEIWVAPSLNVASSGLLK